MRKLSEKGDINVLLIPLIVAIVLLTGATAFAVWAFQSRQDYKSNVDEKIEAAVAVAQENTSTAKDKEFVEKEKQPFRQYQSPVQYGAVTAKYPKTWSAYIDEKGGSSVAFDAYFHPDFVPGFSTGLNYAARLQVTNRSYDQELRSFDSFVKTGKVTVKPYSLPLVPNTVGARIDGEIISRKQGSMVLIPLRDKTIKVWTEATNFTSDFNSIILANMTYTP